MGVGGVGVERGTGSGRGKGGAGQELRASEMVEMVVQANAGRGSQVGFTGVEDEQRGGQSVDQTGVAGSGAKGGGQGDGWLKKPLRKAASSTLSGISSMTSFGSTISSFDFGIFDAGEKVGARRPRGSRAELHASVRRVVPGVCGDLLCVLQ